MSPFYGVSHQAAMDFESERQARVLILPHPYYNESGKPDEVRFAILAEPPISQEEADLLHFSIALEGDLNHISPNPDESFTNSERGVGFKSVYFGTELADGIVIGRFLAGILDIKGTRIIHHKMNSVEYEPEVIPEHYIVEA